MARGRARSGHQTQQAPHKLPYPSSLAICLPKSHAGIPMPKQNKIKVSRQKKGTKGIWDFPKRRVVKKCGARQAPHITPLPHLVVQIKSDGEVPHGRIRPPELLAHLTAADCGKKRSQVRSRGEKIVDESARKATRASGCQGCGCAATTLEAPMRSSSQARHSFPRRGRATAAGLLGTLKNTINMVSESRSFDAYITPKTQHNGSGYVPQTSATDGVMHMHVTKGSCSRFAPIFERVGPSGSMW